MRVRTDYLSWSQVAEVFSRLNEYVMITDNDAGPDREPNVLYCNEPFERSTGYTLQDIQQNSLSDLLGAEDDEEADSRIVQAYAEGKATQVEFLFRNKNDELGWVDLKLNPIRDNEGVIQYWVLIGRDITDQKIKEQEARYNYVLYRQLFDSSPLGIALIDPDGSIHDVNTEFERLFKYEKTEIVGKSLYDLILPEEEKAQIEEAKQKLKAGEKIVRETHRITGDGEKRPVIVTGTPVKFNGEVRYAFGIYTDIQELKEKECALAESLEEKQVLLQEIHHRVKNNLAIISGLLELQSYEVDENSRKAFRDSQVRIQSMSKVHQALYNSPNYSDVDLNDYLHELVESVKTSHGFDERQIELKYDVDSDIQLNINRAVPLALLISELITNAYKHAFDEGEEGNITVKAKKREDSIYVAVIDDGGGMKMEDFKTSQSLGSSIIHSLSDQLNAELAIKGDSGTQIELFIKDEQLEKSQTVI